MMYVTMLESAADKAIFQKLYEENCQKMYYVAWKVLHNEENAEDAVHNGFLNLANNFANYRHQSYENLVKICCIIVKNAAIDIIRENEKQCNFSKEKGFTEDSLPDIGPDILEKIMKQQEKSIVVQALMELEEDERELIYLQYAAGLKPKEIGEMLNMTSAAVRKKTFTCRNKLAKSLESKGYERLP